METSTSDGISLGTDLFLPIYFIITECAISDTDGDARQWTAFFTHFYSLKQLKKSADKLIVYQQKL